jgi:Flp pilus assembly protein CpaB
VGNRRTLIAAVAIVLAVAAFLGVYLYISGADKRAETKVSLVKVLVASDTIARGTSGKDASNHGQLVLQGVPRANVPPNIVTDEAQVKDKYAAGAISPKQFITADSFVSRSQAGGGAAAGQIQDKKNVAVSIQVGTDQAVGNQIAPGDRVNIMVLTEDTNVTPSVKYVSYLLQNAKLLAVGAQTTAAATTTPSSSGDSAAATPSGSGLLTFEASPVDALRIVSAAKNNSIWLTLNPTGFLAQDLPAVPNTAVLGPSAPLVRPVDPADNSTK